MDKELVKSILPEDLYQELIELEKRTPSGLDTCKIPKRDNPISPLSGCVPIIPKFNPAKEIKKTADLINTFLSNSIKSDEENEQLYNEENNKCFNIIDSIVQKISASTIEKMNRNQFIPLQKVLENLSEIVVYNTILEETSYKYVADKESYIKELDIYTRYDYIRYDNTFVLELDENNYYKHIPKIYNYHLPKGIRNFNFHNIFDDIIKSVVVGKEYKSKQQVPATNIMKYYADVFELSSSDIGDGKVDFDKIFYDRMNMFKLYVLKYMNELYNRVLYNKGNIDSFYDFQNNNNNKEDRINYYKANISMFFSGISGITSVYINTNIAYYTNYKLYTQLSIDNKSYDEIVSYFELLNIPLQKNINDYFLTIDILDFEQTKYETIYELSNIPCTENVNSLLSEQTDEQIPFNGTLKRISTNKDNYNFLNSKYWKSWTKGLNLVSLFPNHWTVGIITPTGTKIKLPIIYIHITTIKAGSITTVIWLSINGLAISPVIMTIDGKMKSTWKTLFRGGNQLIEQSQGSKPIPTGFVIPQSVNNATATLDTKVDLTLKAPMLEDAFPSKDRMSISNPAHLQFLNTCCSKAKTFMGLVP